MAQKADTSYQDHAFTEKDVRRLSLPQVDASDGRRKSVALNIVENPLTVSHT